MPPHFNFLGTIPQAYIMDPDHALALQYASRASDMRTTSIFTNLASIDTTKQLLSSLSSGAVDGFFEPPRLLNSVAHSIAETASQLREVDAPMACGWIFGLIVGVLFVAVLVALILRPFVEAWECYNERRLWRKSDEFEFLAEKV